MKYTLLLWAGLVFAGVEPSSIPRQAIKSFVTEGIFEGGTAPKGNIDGLRFSPHKKEGYERWVFDFSDEAGNRGNVAPKFQVRFVKAEKIESPTGQDIILRPSKVVFTFRGIKQNALSSDRLKRLTLKSDRVKSIVMFPAIEEGDLAIEFHLKDPVEFEAHQPLQNEGRLVLDLRSQN